MGGLVAAFPGLVAGGGEVGCGDRRDHRQPGDVQRIVGRVAKAHVEDARAPGVDHRRASLLDAPQHLVGLANRAGMARHLHEVVHLRVAHLVVHRRHGVVERDVGGGVQGHAMAVVVGRHPGTGDEEAPPVGHTRIGDLVGGLDVLRVLLPEHAPAYPAARPVVDVSRDRELVHALVVGRGVRRPDCSHDRRDDVVGPHVRLQRHVAAETVQVGDAVHALHHGAPLAQGAERRAQALDVALEERLGRAAVGHREAHRHARARRGGCRRAVGLRGVAEHHRHAPNGRIARHWAGEAARDDHLHPIGADVLPRVAIITVVVPVSVQPVGCRDH